MLSYYSQVLPQYAGIKFPGTNVSFQSYGCLTCCISNLVQKDPLLLMSENVGMWQNDGNLKTDELCAKLGYKMVRKPLIEGQSLPKFDFPVIARTSWFNPKYPTHFFVIFPDGSLADSARTNPKQLENRYVNRINEIRYLEKIGTPITQSKHCPTCLCK